MIYTRNIQIYVKYPINVGIWSTPCSRPLRRLWPQGAGMLLTDCKVACEDQKENNNLVWVLKFLLDCQWKAMKSGSMKSHEKPITVVVFPRKFLASPGWLPGDRKNTTNRCPKGLEVQPIRTAWTEKSSSGDVQLMLCLRRLRRFNVIHMRFIWESFMYIYI